MLLNITVTYSCLRVNKYDDKKITATISDPAKHLPTAGC